ncbi:hypothetical protein B7463_g3712, partial [Scytalidium lignicola]
MDPLTALGLASNILSFIDFGAKVVSSAIDIYDSPSGLTEESRSSEAIVTEMRHFASKLRPPDDDQLTGDEKALCRLADECDGLSNQIIALIERIRPKDRKLKSASILAGLKSKWHEAERRKLEQRLDHCRAQLALQLHYLTSSEVKGKLDRLVMSAKDDSSRLEQLSSQVSNLGRDVTISSLSPTAQAQIESLLGVSEHAVNLIAQQRILQSLAFEGMYGRYEAVSDAHYKTFEWIFGHDSNSDLDDISKTAVSNLNSVPTVSPVSPDDQFDDRSEDGANSTSNSEVETLTNSIGTFSSGYISQDQASKRTAPGEVPDAVPEEGDRDTKQAPAPVDDPEKAAARKVLLDWLSFGNGIFHISGKLGSGKSTIMKYLCEHQSTTVMLKRWAAGRNLVFANFFFWKPGSSLQKSLTGLFRSLLHDILQTSCELIPYVLPDQWRQMKSTPWHAMKDTHYSDRTIRKAFLRLISAAKLYKDHCFCFFIDGLDEYEGTLQDDTKSLVDQLCYWTTIAPDNIKLCVSSREYNVFMNAFPESKRIRLHQLTRSDMKQYVADKLSHMDEDEDKVELTRAIVDNAHGIFLWVILVTKRIREQIENGNSVCELKREIGTLPQELDDLFTHLLNSLSKPDLKRAYQTFAMVLELNEYPESLPLLAYSFLDDYNRSSSFALLDDFGTAQLESDNSAARIKSTIKRLNGCCSGLVEAISKDTHESLTCDLVIEFTHRSVPEFLSTKSRKDHMLCLLEGFNSVDALSQLTLAALLADANIVRPESRRDMFGILVFLRTRCKLDNAPYLFLEALSAAIARARVLVGFNFLDTDVFIRDFKGTRSGYKFSSILGTCIDIRQRQVAAADPPQHPIYQAAYFGNWEYVRWRLRQHLPADAQISLQILLICILKGNPTWNVTEVLDTVDVLISQGLTPQALTDMSYLDHDPKTHITVWQHLLLTCYYFSANWDLRQLLPKLGYVIERYLEHRADPYFLFYVTMEEEEEEEEEEEPVLKNWVLKLVVGREQCEILQRLKTNRWTPYPFEASSLARFIESFHFENEDRILWLIEKNTKLFEGTVEGGTEEAENSDVDELHEEGMLEIATHQKITHFGSFPTIALSPISVLVVGILVAVVVRLLQIMNHKTRPGIAGGYSGASRASYFITIQNNANSGRQLSPTSPKASDLLAFLGFGASAQVRVATAQT